MIPKEKLEEGFQKCSEQIEFLLTTSKFLYDNGKYAASVPFSILGSEEASKLKLILNHIKKNEDISDDEWKSLTRGRGVHGKKLISTYVEGKEKSKNYTNEDLKSLEAAAKELGYPDVETSLQQLTGGPNATVVKRLEISDKIKQDCFYLNWDNSNWSSFFTKATEEQQEALAYLRIYDLEFELNKLFLIHDYPEIKTQSDILKRKQDPRHQKDIEFQKKLKSGEFQNKQKIALDLLDKY